MEASDPRFETAKIGPTCTVLQPSYLPWRGFFHLIQKADVFVFYDDVQYDRSGWRNRNRIKTSQGTRWLTVPVLRKGHLADRLLLKDARICWDSNWAGKHARTLQQAYGKAPHFDTFWPTVDGLLARRDPFLVDLTMESTIVLARALGLGTVRFVRSSELLPNGSSLGRMDHLSATLGALGASRYVSGPAAKDYLDEGRLSATGIEVEYMSYDYPEYDQLYPPYDPQVSLLDLLFMHGVEAPRWIWGSIE